MTHILMGRYVLHTLTINSSRCTDDNGNVFPEDTANGFNSIIHKALKLGNTSVSYL